MIRKDTSTARIPFKKFAKEHGLFAPRKTPIYVSIDFWSGQNSKLRDRGWYVSRLSKGSFGIFSEDVFEKPYLDLKVENVKNLDLGEVTCARALWNESIAVYSKLFPELLEKGLIKEKKDLPKNMLTS